MSKILIVNVLIIFVAMLNVKQVCSANPDSATVIKIVSKLSDNHAMGFGQKVAEAGKMLVGLPYKSATLEINSSEQLVVNMQEFDCTTLLETCLALALVDNVGTNVFDSFKKNLTFIRYRNGQLNGYASRLHYFTDWAHDNEAKGILIDATKSFGAEVFQKNVDFMGKNCGKYPALVADTLLVPSIVEIERLINQRRYFYIPKEKVSNISNSIKEGCIVAFTTNIAGLDVVHVGIAVKVSGQTHLLHASSDAAKVIISEKTLAEYVLGNKLQSGIMLFEPIMLGK